MKVAALTFDLFGTVLDLGGSLKPFIASFLETRDSSVCPDQFWDRWRERQRFEQFRDSLMHLSHCGYLEAARRALVHTLAELRIETPDKEAAELMKSWDHLTPFPEVEAAMSRLKDKFQLVVLSNGESQYLKYLVEKRCPFDFDRIISVDTVGAFKPHPAVYLNAARLLHLEPGQCLMVSSHPFDVTGARACGFRGAYVNRYGYPHTTEPFQPDYIVADFTELTEVLSRSKGEASR